MDFDMDFNLGELRVCGNCAAFGKQLDHNGSIDSIATEGACRRNPPFVMPVKYSEDGCDFATLFPTVNREDWCKAWVGGDAS